MEKKQQITHIENIDKSKTLEFQGFLFYTSGRGIILGVNAGKLVQNLQYNYIAISFML